MYELREEVKNLREEVKHMLGMVKDLKEEIDVDRVRKRGNDREEEFKSLVSEIIRLRKETDTQVNTQNENNKQLFEMIKDIREDLDVARAVRRQNEISSPETCAENEGDTVTCMAFPCMDNTCREHYTVEGHFRVYNVKGKGRDERRGDKTGGKNVSKGKSAAPHKSLATSRTLGGYHGPGRGQK